MVPDPARGSTRALFGRRGALLAAVVALASCTVLLDTSELEPGAEDAASDAADALPDGDVDAPPPADTAPDGPSDSDVDGGGAREVADPCAAGGAPACTEGGAARISCGAAGVPALELCPALCVDAARGCAGACEARGVLTCSDSLRDVLICPLEGPAEAVRSCDEGETCVGGACRDAAACEPGSWCEGDDVVLCHASGALEQAVRCGEGAACVLVVPDADGDGYGDASAVPRASCGVPPGFTDDAQDCNDDPANGGGLVNPAADETFYDGVDQDCDGGSDYDRDGDGFDASRYVAGGLDCDDDDATVHPDAELDEVAEDGVDRDCDGFEWMDPGAEPFLVGSPVEEEGRAAGDVETQHPVRLTYRFAIMTTEVTQSTWRSVVEADPSFATSCGFRCPVERVNLYEAMVYANRRSSREGLTPCYALDACENTLGGACGGDAGTCSENTYVCAGLSLGADPLACDGYRLPTEAEWEYAARGGVVDARYGELNAVGWCRPQAGAEPASRAVAELEPNAFGLYDMLGNVAEWTIDTFAAYSVDEATDPLVFSPSDPLTVSLRGGSFNTLAATCRAASRTPTVAATRTRTAGFRLVRTLP